MSQYSIVRLSDKPEFKQTMAQWFHEKWGIPLEAYLESMEECLSTDAPYPQWYVALFGDEIVDQAKEKAKVKLIEQSSKLEK